MELRFEQRLKQSLSQRIDPKLILANNILQLSQLELQQAIEQELAENPALEIPEDDPCDNCDLPRTLCIDCVFAKNTVSSDDVDLASYDLEIPTDLSGDLDNENDVISNIVADVTLHDHLRLSLRAVLPEEQFEIGEYLISNINENGYLECTVAEAAEALGASEQEVEAVLAVIQTLEPSGVGARDLQECLRIQLENLQEDGQGNSLALAIVRDYWQDMLQRRTGRIARKFKVSTKQVMDAFDFIKRALNPYPGNAFRPPYAKNADDPRSIIRPDVIVRRTPTGYDIEVVQNDYYLLAINSHYRQAYEALKNGKSSSKYSDDEKKHIIEFVERADLFIRNINQRRRTLRLITKVIVEMQQGYIETSSKLFLRPLTRSQVAKKLGVHESTVSRATANKYVQLPSEEVVPFDFFFDASVSVKDLIAEMIREEDSKNPLSDMEIARRLQERGLNVARRTVVKYREAQRILSSRQRRR